MSPLFIGRKIYREEALDSTNGFASELLSHEKVAEGTVVTTNYQKKGRGQTGNTWQSDAGKNLLLSVILYPSFLDPRHHFFLNQAVSLAVADSLERFVEYAELRIKWPNDILLHSKKTAGILIENAIQRKTIQHSVIGIGINVNQENFPNELKHVSSMKIASGKEYDLEKVMDELFIQLEHRYLQLRQNKIEQLQKDYMKKLFMLEEECFYKTQEKKFRGKIVGLTADGKLTLLVNGEHEVFGFKEVEMVY